MTYISPVNAPLPTAPEEYDQEALMIILEQIQDSLVLLAQAVQTGYSVSNVTTTRTFDADATSTAELADVLGTLITDLKNSGRLG